MFISAKPKAGPALRAPLRVTRVSADICLNTLRYVDGVHLSKLPASK